jgi:site-specific recombinase XerC
MRRNAAKRKASHSRPPAERYTALSVGHAIEKAAKRANRLREQHLADCGPNLPGIEPWAPNRIRHSHATEVRKRFGVAAAGAALGHSRMSVTELYAERDLGLAEKVAMERG